MSLTVWILLVLLIWLFVSMMLGAVWALVGQRLHDREGLYDRHP